MRALNSIKVLKKLRLGNFEISLKAHPNIIGIRILLPIRFRLKMKKNPVLYKILTNVESGTMKTQTNI